MGKVVISTWANGCILAHMAVSYTHLDVYKRQDISRVTIYDQFNKVVHAGNLNDSYGNIDITQLHSGIYSVMVQLANGEVLAKKFYKQ